MFSKFCQKVVEQLGNKTLIPVQSTDEQENVKLFQLVVMEKKGLFYPRKNSYSPTAFQLAEILEDTTSIRATVKTRKLPVKYQLSVKEGAGISLLQDIIQYIYMSIKGTEQVNVTFANFDKTEVNISLLMEELKKRKLKLNNEFIKKVLEEKNQVLCLITGVVHSTERSHISRETSGSALLAMPSMLSGQGNIVKKQKLILDPGNNSPLAYNAHELEISLNDSSVKIIPWVR